METPDDAASPRFDADGAEVLMMPIDLSVFVADMFADVCESMRSGQVPASVTEWSQLHDFMDANDIAIDAGVPWPTGNHQFMTLAEDAVSAMLARGDHFAVLAKAIIDNL